MYREDQSLVSEKIKSMKHFKDCWYPFLHIYWIYIPPSDGNSGIFCRYQPYEVEDVNGSGTGPVLILVTVTLGAS